MKQALVACFALCCLFAAVHTHAALVPPVFDTVADVSLASGPTIINGLQCNGPSDQTQCVSYSFDIWIKAPADTSRRRLIPNSHYVTRTENGGCFGFPGATYFPGYSDHQITDQSDPNHWDLTLSSTYDYELVFPFDQTAHDDVVGTPRSDQRTWDNFWHTINTQDANTVYTSQTDPCSGLTGADADHCKRCTRGNGESDRGYCRTGVNVANPAGTGAVISNPDTFLTCLNEYYMLGMQDDCFKPGTRSDNSLWSGQLTYQLSAPDYQYDGYTYHSLTLHGDNFAIGLADSCPYGGTQWTHTHPSGVADSDLATRTLSFQFDVYEQPLTGGVWDNKPTKIETMPFAWSA